MPKVIYISGAITGQHPDNVRRAFSKAEFELILEGHTVINPMSLCHDHDGSWEEAMAVDIKALLTADAIYMLSNWKKSRGARIERAIAKEMGIDIIYETSPSRMWWLKRLLAGRELKEVSHA
jgi:hypothetical protein